MPRRLEISGNFRRDEDEVGHLSGPAEQAAIERSRPPRSGKPDPFSDVETPRKPDPFTDVSLPRKTLAVIWRSKPINFAAVVPFKKYKLVLSGTDRTPPSTSLTNIVLLLDGRRIASVASPATGSKFEAVGPEVANDGGNHTLSIAASTPEVRLYHPQIRIVEQPKTRPDLTMSFEKLPAD
jgi:hypothetical protein